MSKIHHGGNVEEIAEKLNVPMEEIKDFSANINPLGFPSDLWNVLVQSFANIEVYPNPKYPELKKAIAQHLGINSDDVFVGNFNKALHLTDLLLQFAKLNGIF